MKKREMSGEQDKGEDVNRKGKLKCKLTKNLGKIFLKEVCS